MPADKHVNIVSLKERIFSKYDYLQPKIFYKYDLDSTRFRYAINQYANTLYEKIKNLKLKHLKHIQDALSIRKEELEEQISRLSKQDEDLNVKKRLVFLNTVLQVIATSLMGKKNKIKWL